MADYPFVKYFKYLLFDHKRLIIPGLGKFYLDRLPAAIGADRQVIEPPSYHLRFEKDFIQQNYDSFSELKSYYPKLQESDFKNYARQVIDQLLSRGYVAIDDLGKLRMDNGEISFDKNLETQSMLTADLPILSLGNLKTFIPLSAYRLVERISVPSLWWTILLPLITVALLTAGLLMVYARKDDGPQNKPIIVDKPVETNTDTVYSEDTVKSENNEEFLDSLKALEEEIRINDSLAAIVKNGSQNADGTYNKKCIIITGAYKTKKYKDLMIKKLIDRNLKVYTETSSLGLTRVGFEFECAEKDLPKYLDSIRTAIQDGAWYLIPDLNKKEG